MMCAIADSAAALSRCTSPSDSVAAPPVRYPFA